MAPPTGTLMEQGEVFRTLYLSLIQYQFPDGDREYILSLGVLIKLESIPAGESHICVRHLRKR